MAKRRSTIVTPIVVIALVLGSLGYYWYSHRDVPAPAVTDQKTETPAASVPETIQAFLAEQHSPLAGKVSVGQPSTDGDYARAAITPMTAGTGDGAICFLRRQGGRWEVIAIGTVFEPEFYAQHSIPRSLQL